MIDRDGKMVMANRRYSQTFGLAIKTIKGHHSCYPAHGETAELLIAATDQALYLAKRKGRNRVEHSEI